MALKYRLQFQTISVALLVLTDYLFQSACAIGLDEFDFIIVGAGSAGSVIADRLSERIDYQVLVVDAGDEPPIESIVPGLFATLPRTRSDWNFTSVDDKYSAQSHTIKALNLTSGHVLGGGSSVNYMFYVRGCPGDYDPWARAAKDNSWQYNSIFPYFLKSENLKSDEIYWSPYRYYHGTTGFLGVTRENRPETYKYLEAFKEAGHDIVFDINNGRPIGYTLPLYTIANGVRQTTALTNLAPHKYRLNLHILKNTFVTQILIDKNNNAIGIKAVRNGKTITIKARKEVIVSAGTFNTPKLLMLSGVGPKEHLKSLKIKVRSDLPVGFNLQDHVLVLLSITMEKSSGPSVPVNPNRMPFPIVNGYVTLDKFRSCPQYQVINFLVPHDSDVPYQICSFNSGIEKSLCQNMLEAGKGKNAMFSGLNILHPKSKGRVTLGSKNPFEPPVINMGTFTDDNDLEDLTSYVQDFLGVMNTTYFRKANSQIVNLNIPRCKGLRFGSRDYWKCYVLETGTTIFHYVGTSALGLVVDNRLRVFNINRLRVADASIMPSLPSGNTNAVVIMIAEKVSDMIKQEHPFVFPSFN